MGMFECSINKRPFGLIKVGRRKYLGPTFKLFDSLVQMSYCKIDVIPCFEASPGSWYPTGQLRGVPIMWNDAELTCNNKK